MRPHNNNNNHTPKKFAVKICLLFDNAFNVIIITVKNFIWCTNYPVLRKRKHNESIHIYFRGEF